MDVSHVGSRLSRRLRSSVAAALVLTVTLVAITPGVAQASAVFDGGSATCRIRIVDTDSDGRPVGILRRIVVAPPQMYGEWDWGQTVSWRFVVYTSYRYWEGNPWTVYYKSPVQRGVATPTEPASFTKMLVRLAAPSADPIVQYGTAYRVELRMAWWYPKGNALLHSRVNYLLPNMLEVVDGNPGPLVMPCYYRYPYP